MELPTINRDELFPSLRVLTAQFFSIIQDQQISILLDQPIQSAEAISEPPLFNSKINEKPLFFSLFSDFNMKKLNFNGFNALFSKDEEKKNKMIKVQGVFGPKQELSSYLQQKNIDYLEIIKKEIPNVYLLQEKPSHFILIFWLFCETNTLPSKELLSYITDFIFLEQNAENPIFIENPINFHKEKGFFSKKLGQNYDYIFRALSFIDSEIDCGIDDGMLLIDKFKAEQTQEEKIIKINEFVNFFKGFNLSSIEGVNEQNKIIFEIKALFQIIKQVFLLEGNDKVDDLCDKIKKILLDDFNSSIDTLFKHIKQNQGLISLCLTEEEWFFVNFNKTYPSRLNDLYLCLNQTSSDVFRSQKRQLLESVRSFLSRSTLDADEKDLKRVNPNIKESEVSDCFWEVFKILIQDRIRETLFEDKNKIVETLLDLEGFLMINKLKKEGNLMVSLKNLIEDEVFMRIIDKNEGFFRMKIESLELLPSKIEIKVIFTLLNQKKYLLNIAKLTMNNNELHFSNKVSQGFDTFKNLFAIFLINSSGKYLLVNENNPFLFSLFLIEKDKEITISLSQALSTFKEIYNQDQPKSENIAMIFIEETLFVWNSNRNSLRVIAFGDGFGKVQKEKIFDMRLNDLSFKKFIPINKNNGILIDAVNNGFYRAFILEDDIIIKPLNNNLALPGDFYYGFFSQKTQILQCIYTKPNEKSYYLLGISLENNRVFPERLLLENVNEKIKPKFKEISLSQNRSFLITILGKKMIKIPLNSNLFRDLQAFSNKTDENSMEFVDFLLKTINLHKNCSFDELSNLFIPNISLLKLKKPIFWVISIDFSKKSEVVSLDFQIFDNGITFSMVLGYFCPRKNLFILSKLLSMADLIRIFEHNPKNHEINDFIDILGFPKETSVVFTEKLTENDFLENFGKKKAKFDGIFELFVAIKSIFSKKMKFSANLTEETRDFQLISIKKQLKNKLFNDQSALLIPQDIVAFKGKIPYRFEVLFGGKIDDFEKISKVFSEELQRKFKKNAENEPDLFKSFINALFDNRLTSFNGFFEEIFKNYQENLNKNDIDREILLKRLEHQQNSLEKQIEKIKISLEINEIIERKVQKNHEISLKFMFMREYFVNNFSEYTRENIDFLSKSSKTLSILTENRSNLLDKIHLTLNFSHLRKNLEFLTENLLKTIENFIVDLKNNEIECKKTEKTLNSEKLELENKIYKQISLLRENEQNLTQLIEQQQILNQLLASAVSENGKKHIFDGDFTKVVNKFKSIGGLAEIESEYLKIRENRDSEEILLLCEQFLFLLYDQVLLDLPPKFRTNDLNDCLVQFEILLDEFNSEEENQEQIEADLLEKQANIQSFQKLKEIECFQLELIKDPLFQSNYKIQFREFVKQIKDVIKYDGQTQSLVTHLNIINEKIIKYQNLHEILIKKQKYLKKFPETIFNVPRTSIFLKIDQIKKKINLLTKKKEEILISLSFGVEDQPSEPNPETKPSFRFKRFQDIVKFDKEFSNKKQSLEADREKFKKRLNELFDQSKKIASYKQVEDKLIEVSRKLQEINFAREEVIKLQVDEKKEKILTSEDFDEIGELLDFLEQNENDPQIFLALATKIGEKNYEDLKKKAIFYHKKKQFECFLKNSRNFLQEDILKRVQDEEEKENLSSDSELDFRLEWFLRNTKFDIDADKNGKITKDLNLQIDLFLESFDDDLNEMSDFIEKYLTLVEVTKSINDRTNFSMKLKEDLFFMENAKKALVLEIDGFRVANTEKMKAFCEDMAENVGKNMNQIEEIIKFTQIICDHFDEFKRILKGLEEVFRKIKMVDLRNLSFFEELKKVAYFGSVNIIDWKEIFEFYQENFNPILENEEEFKNKDFCKKIQCFPKEIENISEICNEVVDLEFEIQFEKNERVLSEVKETFEMSNLLLKILDSLKKVEDFQGLAQDLEEIINCFDNNLKKIHQIFDFQEPLSDFHSAKFNFLDFYLKKLLSFYQEVNEVIFANDFLCKPGDFSIFSKTNESLSLLETESSQKLQEIALKINTITKYPFPNQNFINEHFINSLEFIGKRLIEDFLLIKSNYLRYFCDICRTPLSLCRRNHEISVLNEKNEETANVCFELCLLCKESKTFSRCSLESNHQGPHLCGSPHKCLKKCSILGYCEILRNFASGTIEPKKHHCIIQIPSNLLEHEGRHVCNDQNAKTHYCGRECRQCLNVCIRPFHSLKGLCSTDHGFIKKVFWKSKNPFIRSFANPFLDNISDLLKKGLLNQENSEIKITCAEACLLLGRGHLHSLKCNNLCEVYPTFYQHLEAKKKFDYMNCKDYFERHLNFQQPIQRKEFEFCGFKCGNGVHHQKAPQFCQEKLFHQPVFYKKYRLCSEDGHVFDCENHNKGIKNALHIVVFVDSSKMDQWREWVNQGLNEILEKYEEGVYLSIVMGTNEPTIILNRVLLNSRNFIKQGECSSTLALNLDLSFKICLSDFKKKFPSDFLVFVTVSFGIQSISSTSLSQIKDTIVSNDFEVLTYGSNRDAMKKIAELSKKGRFLLKNDQWNIGVYSLRGTVKANSSYFNGFYLDEHEDT